MTDSLSIIHHLIDGVGHNTFNSTEEVYRSSNGDAWQLIRESAMGRVLVRHTSNPSSGGTVTDLSVEQFLACSPDSPQHEAVRVFMAKSAKDV